MAGDSMARPKAFVNSAEPSAKNTIPASAPPDVRPQAYVVPRQETNPRGIFVTWVIKATLASTRRATYLHDISVIGGDANRKFHTLCLQVSLGINKGWKVRLGASRREGAWHTKNGNFLASNQLGEIDFFWAVRRALKLHKVNGRELVPDFDFGCHFFNWSSREGNQS
jgi:hypothetical protein